MKLLIPLLIVSTSALAATTIQYAQRANTERKRADEAVVTSQKQEVRIRELQLARNDLDQRLLDVQRQATSQPTIAKPIERTPAAKPAASPTRMPAPAAMFGVMSNVSPGMRGFAMAQAAPTGFIAGSPWQQMSPAAQRYMKLQTRTMLRRQYEDLGPALGLSQEQSNQVIDLLGEQMSRGMVEPRKALNDMTSMMKQAQEMKARNDAEMAALIGEDKVRLWQDYQSTLPQRSQVNMVRDQMQMLGTPLTDDQRGQLLSVMLEDRETPAYPQPTEGLAPEEQFELSMKWQEEHDRRLLERMKGVLTSEQYTHYRDYQEYQSEMRNNFRKFRPPMPVNGVVSAEGGNSVVLRSYTDSAPVK